MAESPASDLNDNQSRQPFPPDAAADVPVSRLLRHASVLASSSSLSHAASLLRMSNFPAVIVTEGGTYAGILTEKGLLIALEQGRSPDESIGQLTEQHPVLAPNSSVVDARLMLHRSPYGFVVVVDEAGEPWGGILPSDLFEKAPLRPPLPPAGGLATPFGVYLTAGSVWAGPRPWGLISTGAYLTTLFVIGKILAVGLEFILNRLGYRVSSSGMFDIVATFALFGILMRLSPLAGIHAAEHKAVHALERDEPLTAAAVGKMPRVHPRCGTNLAVLVLVVAFFGIGGFGIPPVYQGLQFVVVFAIAFFNYRRFGGLVQYWITTKNPNKAQIEMGCRSAEELAEKAAHAPRMHARGFQSFLNTGLVHVLVGGWIAGLIYYGLFTLIHRPDLLPF